MSHFGIYLFEGLCKKPLVALKGLELEVPKLPGMPNNRQPDLTVMLPEHIELMEKRGKMAISITRPVMPPPLLVVEVVSPYNSGETENFSRDYIEKPQQYSLRGIPEYWIIDPQQQQIEVHWQPGKRQYQQQKTFRRSDLIKSSLSRLQDLNISVQKILNPSEGGFR